MVWLDGESHEPINGTAVIDGFTITTGNADADGGSWPDCSGGGLFCVGSGSGAQCSPRLTNVAFSANSARHGGAMYNYSCNGGTSSPTLTNVTFNANSAAEDGGAMCNHSRSGGTSSPTLDNVTFSGNWAYGCGAMCNHGHDGGNSSPMLVNVILWGNTAHGDGDQMHNRYATLAIGYSLVEGGWDGTGNIDADPQFVDPEGGNLRLRGSSPAIDAGDNTAVPSSVTTDLDGNPRFADVPTIADTGNGTPPIVDMGAHEMQNKVYVPLVLKVYP